jgi:glycosyltransferase involved in cell wall biosynthesis
LPEVAGGAAVLVDAKDPEQLAREIARLVSSPEMRNYLRARGHARAKKFSWDSAATQTLAVFSGLRPSFGQA